MKKIILTITILALTLGINAQETDHSEFNIKYMGDKYMSAGKRTFATLTNDTLVTNKTKAKFGDYGILKFSISEKDESISVQKTIVEGKALNIIVMKIQNNGDKTRLTIVGAYHKGNKILNVSYEHIDSFTGKISQAFEIYEEKK